MICLETIALMKKRRNKKKESLGLFEPGTQHSSLSSKGNAREDELKRRHSNQIELD